VALRIVLRVFFWAFILIVIAGSVIVWWFVYSPLPQLDGSISLPGFSRK
jgi:hypothetical protein